MGEAVNTAAPADVLISGLTVHRGGRLAVDDVSMAWRSGRVTALVGPNGAGKSSLLAAVAGIIPPSAGSVTWNGTTLARRDVAVVLQSIAATENLPLTVAEVVSMGRYPHRGVVGRFRSVDRDSVAEAMERLEVADLADRRLGELSGGQRQRVLVAQGLAQQAPVLLLDEPAQGLDAPSRDTIGEVVATEARRGAVVVMSTHDLAEASEADDTALIDGSLIAAGPSPDVITDANLAVAYRGRILRIKGESVLIDDPGHHHDHDHSHSDH